MPETVMKSYVVELMIAYYEVIKAGIKVDLKNFCNDYLVVSRIAAEAFSTSSLDQGR